MSDIGKPRNSLDKRFDKLRDRETFENNLEQSSNRALNKILSNRLAVVGLTFVILMISASIFAPLSVALFVASSIILSVTILPGRTLFTIMLYLAYSFDTDLEKAVTAALVIFDNRSPSMGCFADERDALGQEAV